MTAASGDFKKREPLFVTLNVNAFICHLKSRFHEQSLFLKDIFSLLVGFPLYPEVLLLYYTMILQRIRFVVGDARFEPRTSVPKVWCNTIEPFYAPWIRLP